MSFFADTFTGSGTIVGHAADTGFGGFHWAEWGGLPALMYLSGGSAVCDNTTTGNYAGATYGDSVSYFGPSSVNIAFSFTTGADVTVSAGRFLFQVSLVIGDTSLGVLVWETAGAWQMTFGGVAPVPVTLAPNTSYSGTLSIANGVQSVTVLGQTLTDVQPYTNPTTISQVQVFVGDVTKFDSIDITDTAVYGAAVTLPQIFVAGFGGYSGALGLPAVTVAGNSGATGVLALPALIVFGTAYTGAAVAPMGPTMNLPQIIIAGFGGYSGNITFPALIAGGSFGSRGALALPSLTGYAAGHDSTGENAAVLTLPSLALAAQGGANAQMTLPMVTLAISATFVNLGLASVALPALTIDAAGTVPFTGQAALLLPMPALVGNFGSVLSITLPSMTAMTSGVTGNVGRAQVTLPLFDLVADGTVNGASSAMLILPALSPSPSGSAHLIIPGLSLVAIGSAVVTATYEAYAINLNHTAKPGDNTAPVDEMTRYTNYPFTQIVRYQNSYFGVAADGLYLLEGTVDVATPIPWAVKTAMTDFKSPFQKTVASAYFAGRLGAADTITLYAGEGAQVQPYNYTTPRGALAQNYRQAFGKGIKQHRYYALGLSGTGELALDSIELDTHDTKRRI